MEPAIPRGRLVEAGISVGQEAERLAEVAALSESLYATERRASEASDYATPL